MDFQILINLTSQFPIFGLLDNIVYKISIQMLKDHFVSKHYGPPTGHAIILPLALMCIIVMRYVKYSLHTVHVHHNNGPRRANLSSRLHAMLG